MKSFTGSHAHKYANVILAIILMMSFALSGCAAVSVSSATGAASPIGTAATIKGLQSVAQGAPGTLIYQSGESILMAWPKGMNYAFAQLSTAGSPIKEIATVNGRAIVTYRMVDLIKAMESSGWTRINPEALPGAVTTALFSYTVNAILAGARTLPSIIILPAMIIPEDPNAQVDG